MSPSPRRPFSPRLIAFAAFAFGVALVSPVASAQDAPTNLKVLPKSMTRPQVTALMKEWTKALGVKCNHCHVTETEPKDFASDAKKPKETAREMLRLQNRINAELFTWKGAPKATCFMCHHGELEPAMKP